MAILSLWCSASSLSSSSCCPRSSGRRRSSSAPSPAGAASGWDGGEWDSGILGVAWWHDFGGRLFRFRRRNRVGGPFLPVLPAFLPAPAGFAPAERTGARFPMTSPPFPPELPPAGTSSREGPRLPPVNRRLFLEASARAAALATALPAARAFPVFGQEGVFRHGGGERGSAHRPGAALDAGVRLHRPAGRRPLDGRPRPGTSGSRRRGRNRHRPGRDYTVKVTAPGLRPGTTYHYTASKRSASTRRWVARGPCRGTRSGSGWPSSPAPTCRSATSMCNRRIAERGDLDAVLHLGDYLYEYPNRDYGDGTRFGRTPRPDKEITTLADYRTPARPVQGRPRSPGGPSAAPVQSASGTTTRSRTTPSPTGRRTIRWKRRKATGSSAARPR